LAERAVSVADRRRFLASLAAFTLAAPMAGRAAAADIPEGVPASGSLRFEIWRKGSLIGHHEMRFNRHDSALAIESQVEMSAGWGPFTFYRYRHHGIERWAGGAFADLSTHTNDNGKILTVTAARTAQDVTIDATKNAKHADWTMPPTALPLTHWNKAAMTRPIFNPQTGKPIKQAFQPRGIDTIALADGRQVRAHHYFLPAKVRLDEWYDAQGLWVGLRAVVKDGSVLEYRRMDG
jgi:hypothetical protein